LGSHPEPRRRQQGTGIIPAGPEPFPGDVDQFVLPSVEPGTPPGKTAVSQDMVSTLAHESHILVGLIRAIMIDDGHGKREMQIAPDPLGLITEDEKVWLFDPFGQIFDTTQIVVKITGTVQGIDLRVGKEVAAADVQADRLGGCNHSTHVEIFSGLRVPEGEIGPDVFLDILKIFVAVPVPVEVDVPGQLENFRVELELFLLQVGCGQRRGKLEKLLSQPVQ